MPRKVYGQDPVIGKPRIIWDGSAAQDVAGGVVTKDQSIGSLFNSRLFLPNSNSVAGISYVNIGSVNAKTNVGAPVPTLELVLLRP